MNDKSAPRRSLREEYGGHLACWEEKIRADRQLCVCRCGVGIPVVSLIGRPVCGRGSVADSAMVKCKIEIYGPKALDFYKDFAKGKGTWCKADGKEILSVTFIRQT